MIKLLIFDLDGTLLDTVADLAASTNYALKLCGFHTHEKTAYNFFVGNGINKLFERALPENHKTSDNISLIRMHFIEYYNKHSSDLTTPYKGIKQLLSILQENGYQLAVASNKYQEGTESLVQYFFPEIDFTTVFGQRENIPIKPDPEIVSDILKVAKVNKEEVFFIGDSGVDMQTAKNANVKSIGVSWGFRPRAELEKFTPDYIVDNTNEILDILGVTYN